MSSAVPMGFGAHLAPLHSYAVRLTGSREDAKDLLQDTLVRYLVSGSSEQEIKSVRAWLFTVMKNHWINTARTRRTFQRLLNEYPQESASHKGHDEAAIEYDVRIALDSLPGKLQDVLCANVIEEGCSTDVAKRLRISRITATTRMKEARRRVLKKLDPRHAWA